MIMKMKRKLPANVAMLSKLKTIDDDEDDEYCYSHSNNADVDEHKRKSPPEDMMDLLCNDHEDEMKIPANVAMFPKLKTIDEDEDEDVDEDNTKLPADGALECSISSVLEKSYAEQHSSEISSGYALFSIDDGWKQQAWLCRSGRPSDMLLCPLHCNTCHHDGMALVIVGNDNWVDGLKMTDDWYLEAFISRLTALANHDAHMTTVTFPTDDQVKLVLTPYPNKPIMETLPRGDATHFVSVIFNSNHFAVLYYDIKSCKV